MLYVMLSNLQVILLLACLIIERFQKVFMRRFAMSSIVVYHTTIIPNISNKVANGMELRVVKDWSKYLEVN